MIVEEVTDKLLDIIEKKLEQIDIELNVDELDMVRDVLEEVLEQYGEL